MKYKTIVIDPPWNVKNGFRNEKYYRYGRKLPYETMTDQELLDFPISDFADANCDLFLWCIHSKLPFAFHLLEKWNFQFHVLLTWDKKSGLGINGFYRCTELVLYAHKGKMGIDISKGNYIPTLLKEKSKGHSQKPDILYVWLRKRTSEPRIDIFARKRHYGFDAWGDQVETQLQVPLTLILVDEDNGGKKK